MRKKSFNKDSVLSMASANSLTNKQSIFRMTKSIGNHNRRALHQFKDILAQNGKEPLVKFRTNRKETPFISRNDEQGKPIMHKQMKKVQEDIADIKRQIKHQHSFTEGSTQHKIDKFISILRESVSQKQGQQIYYPVPMPYPYMMQNQYSMPAIQSSSNPQYPRITNTRRNHFHSPLRNITREKQLKAMRLKKNYSKWRRAVNGFIFIIYLKRFCTNAQNSRKILFDKFAKRYTHNFKNVMKRLKEKIAPFFKLILVKYDVRFDIAEGERTEIVRQKIILMRGIIKMIVDGATAAFSENKQEMCKFLYFICKHGNYSCTIPFLNLQQLQLSCISKTFKYVSSDSNLEKASIINFYLIRSLIHGIILSPFQLPNGISSPIIKQNLHLVSSVLYELVLAVQDDYLLKVPKTYMIGNFQQFDFIKMSKSLIVDHCKHRPGELISGLRPQQEIKKYFNFKEWPNEQRLIKILVMGISQSMKVYHKKIIQRHF